MSQKCQFRQYATTRYTTQHFLSFSLPLLVSFVARKYFSLISRGKLSLNVICFFFNFFYTFSTSCVYSLSSSLSPSSFLSLCFPSFHVFIVIFFLILFLKFFFSFPSTMFRFALVFRIILIAPSFVSESDVVADDSGILHHQRKNHEINSLVSITLPSCLIMSFGEPSVCLFVSDITWR